MLLLLFLLGGGIHFIGLDHPDSVVFDEIHFGSYAKAYCCTGEYFFDIHPPHSKLIIAGFARLLSETSGQTFEKIGEAYNPGTAYAFRFAPALTGTLIPLAIFQLLGLLGASLNARFLGGLLFVFDNALILQTRIIALDGFLVLFTMTSLSAFLYANRQKSERMRLALFSLSGSLAGLALATKFTGLVAIGMAGAIALTDLARNRSFARLRFWLFPAVSFLTAAIAVYLMGWYLHFALLTEPGPGDIWGRPSGEFFIDFFKLHGQMLNANTGLSTTHPDASPWWSWPLMITPVFYWSEGNNWIYLVGNPVVWWTMTTLLIVGVITLILSRISDLRLGSGDTIKRRLLWIPLLGYCASFLPIILVSRVLFLYHYFTPLVFSSLFVVLWLDGIGAILEAGEHKQRLSYYTFIAALIAGFLLIAPVTFGILGDSSVKTALFKVFPGWR